jgi:hypothetical protein
MRPPHAADPRRCPWEPQSRSSYQGKFPRLAFRMPSHPAARMARTQRLFQGMSCADCSARSNSQPARGWPQPRFRAKSQIPRPSRHPACGWARTVRIDSARYPEQGALRCPARRSPATAPPQCGAAGSAQACGPDGRPWLRSHHSPRDPDGTHVVHRCRRRRAASQWPHIPVGNGVDGAAGPLRRAAGPRAARRRPSAIVVSGHPGGRRRQPDIPAPGRLWAIPAQSCSPRQVSA